MFAENAVTCPFLALSVHRGTSVSRSASGGTADILNLSVSSKLMSELKLIPANQNRSCGPWSVDHCDVVLVGTGHIVGQIFKEMVSPSNPDPWFWGLSLPYSHYDIRNYGHAESREAAMRAFAARWGRET